MALEMNFRQSSCPSQLKITDMRVAEIVGAPMDCIILRLDTNQGISGFGEVRDFATKKYALQLKRILLGENPCNVNRLFDRIKQFGWHARQGGGVSGVEAALLDLAGKAYGIPVYQMLGGLYRDKIRLYCDTDVNGKHTGKDMGNALKKRMEKGFTMLKMDLGIDMLIDIPGTLNAPVGYIENFRRFTQMEMSYGFADKEYFSLMNTPHPFTFVSITEKGLDYLEEYVKEARGVIGYEIPLAVDHLGHINVESCIKLARRLEKYSIAWMEDCIPWFYTDQWLRLRDSTSVPLCTGEDIFLAENFKPLLESHAVSVIHPDVFTTGGMLETKKTIALAEEYGVAAVIHMAETPVGCMAAASVAAAAGNNFVAMEFHSNDVPWWNSIVKNAKEDIVQNGWIVPQDKPGLGIEELDDEVLLAHKNPNSNGIWESTDEWNKDQSNDRIWS